MSFSLRFTFFIFFFETLKKVETTKDIKSHHNDRHMHKKSYRRCKFQWETAALRGSHILFPMWAYDAHAFLSEIMQHWCNSGMCCVMNLNWIQYSPASWTHARAQWINSRLSAAYQFAAICDEARVINVKLVPRVVLIRPLHVKRRFAKLKSC